MTIEKLERKVTDGSTAACEHHLRQVKADARTVHEVTYELACR